MVRKDESYADSLRRLFPEENHQTLKVGGNFVRNITFQVTEGCSMRCTYCYQHDKTPKRMSFDIGRKFIDLLLEADERSRGYINSRECPGCIIEFIGGEPFLEIDLIDQLTDYFILRCMELDHPWATRYRLSFTSNGLHYFEPKVQKYLNKHFGNVSLTVTIDGNKELHDACRLDVYGRPTYDRAIAAADDWAKRIGRENNRSKVTLAPANVHLTSKALIDLIEHGYKIIHCNCVYEEGWEMHHATMLYSELKKVADYILDNDFEDDVVISILDNIAGMPIPKERNNTWCGGNGLMMAVAPDGNIYPCLRYAPSSIGQDRKPLAIGNVDKGFLATDEQKRIVSCMQCVTRSTQCAGTECIDCPIASGCGDCAAYSWEKTGRIGSRTTYHCEMHKARVLAITYYLNMRYRKKGEETRFTMHTPREWALPIIGDEEYDKLLLLTEVR